MRKAAQSKTNGSETGATTATDASRENKNGGEKMDKVISPELRHLLTREVDKIEKKEILKHGGGIN